MDLLAQAFQLVGEGICNGPDCDFAALIRLARKLIEALVIITTFFATAAFAYAGIKLLASGGNESAKEDAKGILRKVLIGYLWILFAWLVVYTITSVLLKDGFSLLTR